jgi:Zn-dependent protease
MIQIPGRVPISIHVLFWLLAGFIGMVQSSGSPAGILIWVAIVFVSVVIHEWGHAWTAVAFGQKASIQLMALGGLTSYEGPSMSWWQQFLIVLNGPLSSLALFGASKLLLEIHEVVTSPAAPIIYVFGEANLFWFVVNLLPILPLDGGQLLRIALEALFGVRGFKASLFIGGLVAAIIALLFLLVPNLLISALFSLFAFQSFDSWAKMRRATRIDRDDSYRKLLEDGEKALEEGHLEEAKRRFTEVRDRGHEGVLYAVASEYLAYLDAQEGKSEEAYEILIPLKEQLTIEATCLLHQLAYDLGKDALVAELATTCYQRMQSQKIALNNARAFARLGQGKMAGGWLQTAWQAGGVELEPLLQEDPFQRLQNDPAFRYFIDQLR